MKQSTWYGVIGDCEGGVGDLRVYHGLRHVLALHLHGEVAASESWKYQLYSLINLL